MTTPAQSVPNRIRGVLSPVLTPFGPDLAPDVPEYIRHCKWLLSKGVGLAIFGTNSEAASISVDERLALTDALLAAGIPAEKLMPGTGSCSITDAVRLTRHAVENGAPGVLMLPPFFFKGVSEDGLFAYYAEVIEQVADPRLAIYLYHIPQFTQVPITLTLIERLLKRYPKSVAGAKDSSGDWANSSAMIENFAKDGFDVFPASESLMSKALPIGGAGCISATVNVNPGIIQALFEAHADNKSAEVIADLQGKADVIRAIYQSVPMIPAMKHTVASFSGKSSWGIVRPPLTSMNAVDGSALLVRLEHAGFDMPGLR